LLKCFPDSLLECSAPDVQRQVKAHARFFNETHYLCDHVLISALAADQIRLRELVLKIAHQLEWVVTNKDSTNATLALGYEDRS
jgi:hypothetical protein